MGSGQKLFNTLVKAGVKAVKEAERERIRKQRADQRRLALLERERIKEIK